MIALRMMFWGFGLELARRKPISDRMTALMGLMLWGIRLEVGKEALAMDTKVLRIVLKHRYRIILSPGIGYYQ